MIAFFYKYDFKLFVFLLLNFYSCVSPDPISELSQEEKDLYITNRDVNVNFADYQTYVIVDSVNFVTLIENDTDRTVEAAPLLLDLVNSELQEAGYIKVDTSQNPDVGVSVSVLHFSEEVPVQYFGFTGAGYFGYVPTAFYGFPGYSYGIPPYYGYYQINIGSIAIEMFDLKTARASNGNQLNVIWSALLAGSFTDTTSVSNNERIVRAVSAAFDQSPYLRDGK